MDDRLKAPDRRGRHARTSSDDRRKYAALRRSSRGPLDDPLLSPTPPKPSPSPVPTPRAVPPRSPSRSPLPTLDLTFLLNPSNYHPLPPAAHPPKPLPLNTPLSTLLTSQHHHAAARTAALQLTSLPPSAPPQDILSLFHTRLVSLTLAQLLPLAATESKLLGDLSSPLYRDARTGAHLAPWHLRVLAIRLQALGFGEWRRGLMAYYGLAAEARVEGALARKEGRTNDGSAWEARLRDLALRVAAACTEMGEPELAARHLAELAREWGAGEAGRRALGLEGLSWLRAGDVPAAMGCIERLRKMGGEGEGECEGIADGGIGARVLDALVLGAKGDMQGALGEWEALSVEGPPGDVATAQNLAVCVLYAGRIDEAKVLFERFVREGEAPTMQTLLFNLCTVYELFSDNALAKKEGLTEMLAEKGPGEESRRE